MEKQVAALEMVFRYLRGEGPPPWGPDDPWYLNPNAGGPYKTR